MDNTLPRHDALHVISDIHMGGESDFQVLKETRRLAGYVARLAVERPGQSVALVLNGDVFDTLAEDLGDDMVATHQAVQVITRIMEDPAFRDVWDALAAFVRVPGRLLVLVIGNHDIEMAFPPVQRLLVQRLAGDDLPARARIEFSTVGAGYSCRIGSARVHCTHGNEFDPWNLNRYEDLARVGRRLNCAQLIEAADWRANAGTRMVKEVMNSVKRRYRWIDLLKPETSAAVGALLALDPSQIRRLRELPAIVAEKQAGAGELEGRLSTSSGSADMAPSSRRGQDIRGDIESFLGPNLRMASAKSSTTEDMLLEAERQMQANPLTYENGKLGAGQLVWDRLTGWITGIEPQEALRRALLDWLKDDRTFDLEDRDKTCLEALRHIGSDVDVVVTGHTHLARAIKPGGGRLYFNSGTWIRLMGFTQDMLTNAEAFKEIYRHLEIGTMQALDEAVFKGKPLLSDMTTAVELVVEDSGLVGRLNRVLADGRGTPECLATLKRA